jgi:hypothetical protein
MKHISDLNEMCGLDDLLLYIRNVYENRKFSSAELCLQSQQLDLAGHVSYEEHLMRSLEKMMELKLGHL